MSKKIVCFDWCLLGEWWCAEKGATEDEISQVVLRHTQISATPSFAGDCPVELPQIKSVE